MFNWKAFNKKLFEYICAAMMIAALCCAVGAALYAVIMIPGLVSGQWAFVHALAMLGMMAAFAVLSACFSVLHDAARGCFSEEDLR